LGVGLSNGLTQNFREPIVLHHLVDEDPKQHLTC
jgi:hypothetical protein